MDLATDFLSEILFDHMPMGIAIFDAQLRLQRCNPTWADFIDQYTPTSAEKVVPGVYFFDLAPGTEAQAMPIFHRVLAGEVVREKAVRLESGGIASYWDVTFTPLIKDGRVVGFIDVTADVTEREEILQALRESEANFRSLLENATNFAVYRLAVDSDNPYGGRVMMVSPSITEIVGLSDPYRFESWFEIVHPDDLPPAIEANRQAIELGRPYTQAVRIYHAQKKEWIWVHTTSTPVFDSAGNLTHFNGLILDITEQKRAQEELQRAYETMEQRVQERTRELQTLLDVTSAAITSLDLDEMLRATLDRLVTLVQASRVGVMLLNRQSGELEPRMLRPPRSISPQDLQEVVGACRIVLESGTPLYISPDPERGFREPGALLPLRARGQGVGVLTIIGAPGKTFSEQQRVLFESIADQLGMAVENARLYQAEQERLAEVERRREVAEGLRDILTILNSNHPLDEILDHIVTQAVRLLSTEAVAIYRLQEDGLLCVQASWGLDAEFTAMKIPIGEGTTGRAVQERRLVAQTISAPLRNSEDHRVRMGAEWQKRWQQLTSHYRSLLAVPLIVKDQVYGAITLYYRVRREFSNEEIGLASAFADQAALAIENARLHQQVEQAAAAAERSRLARDLHDAVSQTLFSASLIAEVLPVLWEANPEEGRRRLHELRELTRGAMAEMRALLLELRPKALAEFSLRELLEQLTEAAVGRSRLNVDLKVEGNQPLPADVKVVFYRVAQETLNNIGKHARAGKVTIHLVLRPQVVTLSIVDDGQGFDMRSVPPQSLGLGIMRERAAQIGATLDVTSTIGEGTSVTLSWSQTEEQS